jgi:hypothetical protein
MFGKFKKVSMLALVLGIGVATAPVDAQVNSTIVLKNGQKHSGRNMTYRVDRRELAVRESLHSEPRVPVDQVAYVDFGGTADPTVDLSGSENAVVMRDGSVVKGQVIELGHEKAGDESSTFLVIFRNSAGEERRVPASQVARVYFSGSRSVGTAGAATSNTMSIPDGTGIAVSATQAWTPTGLTVRRGESLVVSATGEARLSGDAEDMASATGSRSGRKSANAPLPQVPAGALIGRVGEGTPFVITEGSTVTMPATGQLFLGINDDHVADNQGGFRVTIRRSGRQ